MFELRDYIKEELNKGKVFNNIAITLSENPYCIEIKENDNYYIFKYNQINSDFNNLIVQDCRGIILRKSDFKVVCYPFKKFGNYGESYCPTIDWSTAKILEKIDGSLIKIWFDDYWHISTNGMIDSEDCDLALQDDNIKTFYDLFTSIIDISLFNELDKDFTYMFEVCSLYNKVVVTHKIPKVYYLGERNNITGQERINNNTAKLLNLQLPKQFDLFSVEACIESASKLPFNEEGYVVVDKNFNRVKIKSSAYVTVHHLKNNGVINKLRILELIELNEHKEFLTYYPEYEEMFNDIETKRNILFSKVNEYKTEYYSLLLSLDNRKEQALFIKSNIISSLHDFFFKVLSKDIDYSDYWNKQRIANKLNVIENIK